MFWAKMESVEICSSISTGVLFWSSWFRESLFSSPTWNSTICDEATAFLGLFWNNLCCSETEDLHKQYKNPAVGLWIPSVFCSVSIRFLSCKVSQWNKIIKSLSGLSSIKLWFYCEHFCKVLTRPGNGHQRRSMCLRETVEERFWIGTGCVNLFD